jgi:hypothetical protein
MKYAVVTADRRFTEAHYDDLTTLVMHWQNEIMVGTHRFWVLA